MDHADLDIAESVIKQSGSEPAVRLSHTFCESSVGNSSWESAGGLSQNSCEHVSHSSREPAVRLSLNSCDTAVGNNNCEPAVGLSQKSCEPVSQRGCEPAVGLSQNSCEPVSQRSCEPAVGLSQNSCEAAARHGNASAYHYLHTDSNKNKQSKMIMTNETGTNAYTGTADCPSVLTHVDSEGRANMVDVGHKRDTQRVAVASGTIFLGELLWRL
jgi:hypothetical protein